MLVQSDTKKATATALEDKSISEHFWFVPLDILK